MKWFCQCRRYVKTCAIAKMVCGNISIDGKPFEYLYYVCYGAVYGWLAAGRAGSNARIRSRSGLLVFQKWNQVFFFFKKCLQLFLTRRLNRRHSNCPKLLGNSRNVSVLLGTARNLARYCPKLPESPRYPWNTLNVLRFITYSSVCLLCQLVLVLL